MLARTPLGPHVAFVLQGLEAGGSEHIVSQLCNHFASQGWTVTLLAFENPTTHPYYSHDPAVRIVPLGMKSERRGLIGGLRAMRARCRLLRKSLEVMRPDIVVSFLTRTNVMACIAARPLGIPVIVSERNNPALQKVGPIWGALRRWAYPRSAGLVTMTKGAMRYFTASMRVKATVIPNPATLPEGPLPRTSDGRTIGAVGRLVDQKGFDLLLDAFARATPQIPDWNLVIWGEGADRAALEQQRGNLGLDGKVALPGVTERPGEWISRSDMFVFSSRFEGWGLVVGEAMAAGLPVVSFDCEWGPAEMIEDGHSGFLIPNGDVEAMAHSIVTMCQDEELRRRFAEAGRVRMQNFTPDRIFAAWQQVITDALVRHRERVEA